MPKIISLVNFIVNESPAVYLEEIGKRFLKFVIVQVHLPVIFLKIEVLFAKDILVFLLESFIAVRHDLILNFDYYFNLLSYYSCGRRYCYS